ncbi:hypothetical protein GCM10025734_50660 [Kitasatospora paranensis]|uniref:hypothetical protein n=1 Tax=Kitasatospora paranensis TaxID=258053 RepID=UPI0031EDDC00
MHRLHRLAGALGAAATALALLAAAPAAAAAAPLVDPHIAVHFDLGAGQTPENIALEPDGAADVTFVGAHQIARVGTDGRIRVLATLPTPPVDSTPLVGVPAPTGIVRTHDGTLFFGYATGTADLTGIWRLSPAAPRSGSSRCPRTGSPTASPWTSTAGSSTPPTPSAVWCGAPRCTAAPPPSGPTDPSSGRPDGSARTASRCSTTRSG